MSTRTCLCIGLVAGLLTIGVRVYPAEEPGVDSTRRRAVRRAADQVDQRTRRSDSTVHTAGVLQSADVLEICGEVEGLRAILHVVPSGSVVKKGDLLVELDASSLRDNQLKQEVALAEARGALVQAETALAGLKEVETGRLAVAELALKVAELDRQKFQAEGGELEMEMNKIEGHLALVQKRLTIAEIVLAQVKKAVEEGRSEEKNLLEPEAAVFEHQLQLQRAAASRQLLATHTRDYRNAALELAVAQAKSTLSQIKIESRIGLQKAETELRTRKMVADIEEKKLARIQQQIANCQIVAPRDGVVLHADSPVVVEQGTMVRQRRPILRMPEMSRLEVRAGVPESQIDRVRQGQPATIRFDAFPEREYRGKVAQVSDAPEPPRPADRQVKKHSVVVSIENPTPELRLGLTALVEIDVFRSNRE